MFNIKALTLVMGLASLTCQSQAWAMNENELEGPDNTGATPRPPASASQEEPSAEILWRIRCRRDSGIISPRKTYDKLIQASRAVYEEVERDLKKNEKIEKK